MKIRRFILITLSKSGRGERKKIQPEEISSRIQAIFQCTAIIIAQEKDRDGERDQDVAVFHENAHRKSARKKIREIFPEWEGIECKVSFHKAWNTICKYVTKEDREPYVWGHFSRDQILQQVRACQNHKRITKEGEGKKEDRTKRIFEKFRECEEFFDFRKDPEMASQLLNKYNSIQSLWED